MCIEIRTYILYICVVNFYSSTTAALFANLQINDAMW